MKALLGRAAVGAHATGPLSPLRAASKCQLPEKPGRRQEAISCSHKLHPYLKNVNSPALQLEPGNSEAGVLQWLFSTCKCGGKRVCFGHAKKKYIKKNKREKKKTKTTKQFKKSAL